MSSLVPVSDWMAIAQWDQCRELWRPGIVFEIENGEGRSMLTAYSPAVPPVPVDWKSPPIQFRAVVEPEPERSAPIPLPRDR